MLGVGVGSDARVALSSSPDSILMISVRCRLAGLADEELASDVVSHGIVRGLFVFRGCGGESGVFDIAVRKSWPLSSRQLCERPP